MQPINKEKVANTFLKSVETYDSNALVQKQVAQHLVELCSKHLDLKQIKVLEIGCGTGVLSELFTQKFNVTHYLLNDLSPKLCEHSELRINKNVETVEIIAGDAEQLTLQQNCDLILSSSTMQWFEDFAEFMKNSSNHLSQNGNIAFSVFIDGTMSEIKELTGRGLQYMSASEMKKTVNKGYNCLCFEEIKNVLYFECVKDILNHIKATGVGSLSQKTLKVSEYRALEKAYESTFRTEKGLSLSYNSLFVVGKKRKIIADER